MIGYEPGQWHVSFIFRIQGSVFPKALAWSLPTALFSAVLNQWVVNHVDNISVTQVWAAYNFTLGFLIVFRTQQAYSRFWEGATLLQQIRAEWFNAISSCFAFCSTSDSKRAEVRKFQHLLARLASLLYCTALQQIAVLSDEQFEVLELDGISESSLEYLGCAPEKSLVVLQWIQKLIVLAHEDGTVTAAPPILSRVYQELSRGIVNVFNAQKITDIVFPFPYAQMVTVVLLMSTIITPAITAMLMNTPHWSAGLTFLSVFVYWCINYIAAEIEMPFGEDPNDLPISHYQEGFNASLRMLLDEQSQKPPLYEFDPQKRHTIAAHGMSCPFELITKVQHQLWGNQGCSGAAHKVHKAQKRNEELQNRRRAEIHTNTITHQISPDAIGSDAQEEPYSNASPTRLPCVMRVSLRERIRISSAVSSQAVPSALQKDSLNTARSTLFSTASSLFTRQSELSPGGLAFLSSKEDLISNSSGTIAKDSCETLSGPKHLQKLVRLTEDGIDSDALPNQEPELLPSKEPSERSTNENLSLMTTMQLVSDCMQKVNDHIAQSLSDMQHSRGNGSRHYLSNMQPRDVSRHGASIPWEFHRVGIETGPPLHSPRIIGSSPAPATPRTPVGDSLFAV